MRFLKEMLSREAYQSIIDLIDASSNGCHSNCLRDLSSKFPNVPHDTLYSIFAQHFQQTTKQCHSQHRKPLVMQGYYKRYLASQDQPEVLLHMSQDVSLSPALLSRSILESYITENSVTAVGAPSTALVSHWMKNPQHIPDEKLREHVKLCIRSDTNYGLLAENVKCSVGYQYEQKLRRRLEEHNIPFLDEEFMRLQGYDKTPDFKLEVPFAVSSTVVNWVESKALFVDENSHKRYMEEQLSSYYNRFGSGMVIYWFGFVEDVLQGSEDQGILIRTSFPEAQRITSIA
ncbi:CDAN1-interacting nuclease 1-like [Dysidea avara]|uniref:CDAN1-interacting nuclease 1-like n=1 Tax=Dysidea avara TaxID=196820 RepID=UPI00332A391A